MAQIWSRSASISAINLTACVVGVVATAPLFAYAAASLYIQRWREYRGDSAAYTYLATRMAAGTAPVLRPPVVRVLLLLPRLADAARAVAAAAAASASTLCARSSATARIPCRYVFRNVTVASIVCNFSPSVAYFFALKTSGMYSRAKKTPAFTKHGTMTSALEDLYRHWHDARVPHTAWVSVRNGVVTCAWRTTDLDRIDTTLETLRVVYAKRDPPRHLDFLFFADDNPPRGVYPMFAYCKTGGADDLTFDVPYGGIVKMFIHDATLDEWRGMWRDASLNIPWDDRESNLYWVGGWNAYRASVVAKAAGHARCDMRFAEHAGFVPMERQGRHRYLVDMQGIGWSARLMAFVFMGAVLFVLDRDLHESWFREHFEPGVHYVRCAHDGSDLIQKFEEVVMMPDGGRGIAEACRARAYEVLDEDFLLDHYARQLTRHQALFGALPYAPESLGYRTARARRSLAYRRRSS